MYPKTELILVLSICSLLKRTYRPTKALTKETNKASIFWKCFGERKFREMNRKMLTISYNLPK